MSAKNKYILSIILSFISIFIVLHLFEINKYEKYIWVFYVLYVLFFLISLFNDNIQRIFLIVNRILLIAWLATYPMGLIFALIASFGLAIKVSLGFYLLPLLSLYLNIKLK